MVPVIPPHPAKFSKPILKELDRIICTYSLWTILDPFAGVGGIHTLMANTIGVEIEPLWAQAHPRTIVGDALQLPFKAQSFDAVITSPTYANRMADHHEAKDGSRRMTYRHTLGQPLQPHNSGQLQWGAAYKAFHLKAWREVMHVLRDDGLLVINVSNHIRKNHEVDVVGWHRDSCVSLGYYLTDTLEVETRRMRFGENSTKRVATESILIFRKARSD